MGGSYKTREPGRGPKSELAVAARQWADRLGSLKENKDGLFGQSVRITTSGNLNILNRNLDMEFTVPFDDDPIPNEAEIVVYNLSKSSIARLAVKDGKPNRITVYAGYVDDVGVIFTGTIKKVVTRFEGVDKKTTIFAVDQGAADTLVKESFPSGSTASQILRHLAEVAGLAVGAFETRYDTTYDRAVSVEGPVNQQLARYAAECGVSAYIAKGRLYVGDFRGGSTLGIRVDERYGLLGTPEEFEEEKENRDGEPDEDGKYPTRTVQGQKVKMLLNHRVTTGVKLTLRSKNARGSYVVRSGVHRYDGRNLTTEVVAIE